MVWASLAALYCRPVQADDLPSVQRTIRERFPTVPRISTAELAGWLADTNRPAPLLVDVRAGKEFSVSHLPQARNLRSAEEIQAALARSNQPVVLYCSVGYRSAAVAEKLVRAGHTNVWNLEGSIFAWANEGRPLFRGTEPVNLVHPYDTRWGRLLDAKRRAAP
jgi:rhodanese-related sulfurtransferase